MRATIDGIDAGIEAPRRCERQWKRSKRQDVRQAKQSKRQSRSRAAIETRGEGDEAIERQMSGERDAEMAKMEKCRSDANPRDEGCSLRSGSVIPQYHNTIHAV